MKSTINRHSKTLKNQINNASILSKERIKTVIESNSKHFDSAVKSNNKTFNSISKLLYENEIDPSIVSIYKSAFIKGLKLSDAAIDSIIDSHTSRINLSSDFATKFIDIIKNEDLSTPEGINKLMGLVKDHFEESNKLTLNNTKKIALAYNDHLHMVLAFNKNIAEGLNAQITSMFQLRKNTISPLDMVTEWWKNAEEEKATV